MSGKPPFCGLHQPATLARVMGDQPPKPEDHPDLPSSDPLWSLMRRCWKKTPAARPTMREVKLEVSRHRSPIPDASDEMENYPLSCKKPIVLNLVHGQGSAFILLFRLLIRSPQALSVVSVSGSCKTVPYTYHR